MHCLIIDDNPKTAALLQQLLKAHDAICDVQIAIEPYLVRSIIIRSRIDIVFVRVRLWEFMGINEMNERPIIVFLSGGKDKLTIKEETDVQFSVREPFTQMAISKIMSCVKAATVIDRLDFLFLRYNGRFHKTLFRDIELIERKEKNYLLFHLKYANPLMPGSLALWIQKLPNDQFIRVSDNLIIPVSELTTIRGDEYCFKGRTIPLSFRFVNGSGNELSHWPDGL